MYLGCELGSRSEYDRTNLRTSNLHVLEVRALTINQPMNENIYTSLEQALLGNPKYVAEDGKILKAIVYSDVMTMNPELLEILLDSPEITQHFFTNVNGTLVFDKQQFAWLLESKEFLPDSYTRYTNKIGLSYRGEFLSKSNDVVLDFPYKDSLLVGGQDHDDQGRDEIFFHDVIASEEITRLLAPKTLSNARKYIQGGGGHSLRKI